MTELSLNKHGSKIHRELFELDTAQIGSPADIIDKHAGDAIFLAPREVNSNDIDGGESDFIAEMNQADPSESWESLGDEFPGQYIEDSEAIGETDITGTATGIARGFGSHLALDLGADGFQIEEIPDTVLVLERRTTEGELDDYDDDDPNNGIDDPKELESFSQPGAGRLATLDDDDLPEGYAKRPLSFNDQLDSSESA